MPIDIDEVIDRAFEQAFAKALDQTLQDKAEALFEKAFANGSPLALKLEQRIEAGFERFMQHGVRWQRRKREDFQDLLISQERRQEPRVPWSEAKAKLRTRGTKP